MQANETLDLLISSIQELSLARDIPAIVSIVRRCARKLTGADGATFVLRDGNFCHYVDEDAISPLWKGQRFPLQICVSGWVMQNREPAVIEDIYVDDRIPIDAYRPTFVKSLAMVPIRTISPIGAIGNYWAQRHYPTAEELHTLQALADSTSIAMENVQLYEGLEARVQERTAELEALNQELDAFAYSVSHDLRAPVRHIDGFASLLQKRCGESLDDVGRRYLSNVSESASRMGQLIDDLLSFSRNGRTELTHADVDLDRLVKQVQEELQHDTGDRTIEWTLAKLPRISGDPSLLRQVFVNLLSNAVKYTGKKDRARIEVGCTETEREFVVFVRDNGAGFDMQYSGKLFGVFQRLHGFQQFEGTGIGLANVRRIVARHGGRTWAEGAVDHGATFYVAFPRSIASAAAAR